jgi:branched-subunit amino acid transport protein
VLYGDGLSVSLGNDRLVAGLVAAGVAWKTENMLATVVAGMGALYALSLVP